MTVTVDVLESGDDIDPEEDGENEARVIQKKKNKRRKGISIRASLWRNQLNTGLIILKLRHLHVIFAHYLHREL